MQKRFAVPTLLLVIAVLSAGSFSSVANAGPRDLVVVRPGGPTASEEANEQVTRLIREIAAQAGWPKDSVSAKYFNRAEDALSCIKGNKPGFLLTTPGFYLAQRETLGLIPVNQILIDGKDTHCYHVVVRKGGHDSLESLKGTRLAGSALAESRFIDRVVLSSAFDFGADITATYMRALSALRKLSKGDLDAVILDEVEYAGLESLPFGGEMTTIFTSAPIPNTGIFALNGTVNSTDITALCDATQDFGKAGEEAAAICETYGISGFKAAPAGVFEKMIQLYSGTVSAP